MLPWASGISPGELLRSGAEEFQEIDPQHLHILFQGVDAEGETGKHGGIPWRLGLLELEPSGN